jgi:hypothetical protein
LAKEEGVKALKEMLRANINEANQLNDKGPFTRESLMEFENELANLRSRNLMIKGSRFTLGEKLQFTKVIYY